jgi:GntR family transcriptional repressor for pyruvate dehydrogenase complex
MTLNQIQKRSVSDEVLEQMKNQIISGEWEPGTKIPGEHVLTDLFGVSRVSVREAIHRLVGMGILNVRRGEGTFVSEILPGDYFSSLLPVLMIERDDLADILEFRAAVEVKSAELAAQRATSDDIRRLEEIIDRMRSKQGDHPEFAREDLNFHTALALASHNSVILKVNAIIHDMLKLAMEKIVEVSGFEGGLYYHGQILEAIKRKDSETAVKMMEEHIAATIERMR